jgi:hypothetical protein
MRSFRSIAWLQTQGIVVSEDTGTPLSAGFLTCADSSPMIQLIQRSARVSGMVAELMGGVLRALNSLPGVTPLAAKDCHDSRLIERIRSWQKQPNWTRTWSMD